MTRPISCGPIGARGPEQRRSLNACSRRKRPLPCRLDSALADVLPKPGLLVESVKLAAAEIATRYDTDNPAFPHDRQVTATGILHQTQRVDCLMARCYGFGCDCHH